MVSQSHKILLEKTELSWGTIAFQVTLLKSGPAQGPKNDPIDMRPGVLWGIWSTQHGGWGDQETPQRGEIGTRVQKDIGPSTLPRYHCYTSCSRVSEGNFENVEEVISKQTDTGVQELCWCQGWPATSVTSWKSCGEIWDTGTLSKMSNMQLLSGGVWFEPKQSDSRTCVLCCENI